MVAYGLPVMVNDLGGLVANANQVTPLKRENFSTCFSKVSSSISGPCLRFFGETEMNFWCFRCGYRWFFSRKSSQKTKGGKEFDTVKVEGINWFSSLPHREEFSNIHP